MDRLVYLSLGSNIGDRAAHIARAVAALDGAGVRVLRQSSPYRTEPVDFRPQAWFLNAVIEAETELMPRQLLRMIQEVERSLGRRRMVARGPRVIDIDVLLYGSNIIRTPELEVPHPRLAERRFVLVPLRELAPGLRVPGLQKTVAELLCDTTDRGRVIRWKEDKGENRKTKTENRPRPFQDV